MMQMHKIYINHIYEWDVIQWVIPLVVADTAKHAVISRPKAF
jgi:hypothetical protein